MRSATRYLRERDGCLVVRAARHHPGAYVGSAGSAYRRCLTRRGSLGLGRGLCRDELFEARLRVFHPAALVDVPVGRRVVPHAVEGPAVLPRRPPVRHNSPVTTLDGIAGPLLAPPVKRQPLLQPNAWDIGSARMLASLGFGAVATTSSGF